MIMNYAIVINSTHYIIIVIINKIIVINPSYRTVMIDMIMNYVIRIYSCNSINVVWRINYFIHIAPTFILIIFVH